MTEAKAKSLTSLGDAVMRIDRTAKSAAAPAEFKAVANAVRSPVELVSAIVKWTMTLDDAAIAALDRQVARCCRLSAEAVAVYGFDGLKREATALWTKLVAVEIALGENAKAAPVSGGNAHARS